jgi:hypothetical protein
MDDSNEELSSCGVFFAPKDLCNLPRATRQIETDMYTGIGGM